MDLWTALRVIGRHRLVLLSGLVMTALVVAALGLRLEQKYSATGTVIVISPGGRTNPLDLYSSSSPLGASVATTLGGADTSKAEVKAEGGTSDYTLVTDPNLPIVTITTTSANPSTAVQSFGLVSQLMNRLLGERQATFATPASTQLEVLALTTPAAATVTTFKLAVMGVAGGLGLVLAVAAALIADGARDRRRARREARVAPAVASGAAVPPESQSPSIGPAMTERGASGEGKRFAEHAVKGDALTEEPIHQPAEGVSPPPTAGVRAEGGLIAREVGESLWSLRLRATGAAVEATAPESAASTPPAEPTSDSEGSEPKPPIFELPAPSPPSDREPSEPGSQPSRRGPATGAAAAVVPRRRPRAK